MNGSVGNCVLTASQAGNASFNPAPDVARTVVAAKRPITVTADANSKTYGADDPVLSYQLTSGSLVSGDSFSGSLSRVAGETVAGSPYAIQQGTLTAGGHYDLIFVGASFTINKKAASVTPAANSKTYGAADPALTGTLSGFLAGDGVTASYGACSR